jgi:hypothetical protein
VLQLSILFFFFWTMMCLSSFLLQHQGSGATTFISWCVSLHNRRWYLP